MKCLKKWIKNCIYGALEDRKSKILARREPCENDDFCKDSTWECQDTGQIWIAVNRKTEWVEKNEK